MADVITGNTQIGPTKQDLVAAIVQRELAFQAKLVPTISDWSALAVKGAKSLNIPRAGGFTVVNRASGAAGDASTVAFGTDPINLDLNLYVSWIIDSYDEYQASPDVQLAYIRRAASAHARKVDSEIIAVLEDVFFNTAGTGAMTYAKIVAARRALLEKNAQMDQTVLVGSPQFEADLISLSEFKDASVYGMPTIPNMQPVGRIHGIPFLVHNGITGNIAYMYDKDGVGIAFQQGANMSEQGANAYGSKAVRVAMDQVLGIGGLQIAQAGVAAGKSALVYKIVNT